MIRVLAAFVLAAGLLHSAAGVRPKLLVAIVVDQFRYDYLTRFGDDYKSGLARLMERGAVFTNAHYEHFPTVTAIGHATLLSGALPSVSGIVGNEWYDRAEGLQVSSVTDRSVKALGGSKASSPRRLLVSTLADELKMSGRGETRAIGISIKDRSAILPVGRMADAAYWLDEATGTFASSTYYFADLPGWVKDHNRGRPADRYLGKQWLPVGGGKPFVTMSAQPDAAFYKSMERTPYGNELLAQFVERALDAEQLGRHTGVDVLAISFSSNDYVGHDVGPDAPEVRDISIRTDRLLGSLLDLVDARVGRDNVLVVLTADHGVAPLPELMEKRRMPGGRITKETVHQAVEKALSARFGSGKWVAGYSGPAPYLNYDLIRQKGLDESAVVNEAAAAVSAIPHIARVYTRAQLWEGRILPDPLSRSVANGFHPLRAADLAVISEPYWLFEEKGTSHGTPYHYDTHVPLIFMGPGIKPGRYRGRVAVNDIAPTLAALLEVETPAGSIGRVLDEALALP